MMASISPPSFSFNNLRLSPFSLILCSVRSELEWAGEINSSMPLSIRTRLTPAKRLTFCLPPRPKLKASLPKYKRAVCSSKCGNKVANFDYRSVSIWFSCKWTNYFFTIPKMWVRLSATILLGKTNLRFLTCHAHHATNSKVNALILALHRREPMPNEEIIFICF
ncbi:hypothetical protein EZS27_020236 [termite gut metagenome]|uniref:Uncharacterized protein n=1 Tax=termite gut metagenome TaxID=433724 RepID=A0A5J4REA5_9ZZZZ